MKGLCIIKPTYLFKPPIKRKRINEWYLFLLAMKKSNQILPLELIQQILNHLVDFCYDCDECGKVDLVTNMLLIGQSVKLVWCSKVCEKTYFQKRYRKQRARWTINLIE